MDIINSIRLYIEKNPETKISAQYRTYDPSLGMEESLIRKHGELVIKGIGRDGLVT